MTNEFDSQKWWNRGMAIGFCVPVLYSVGMSVHDFFAGELGSALLYPFAGLASGFCLGLIMSVAVGVTSEAVNGLFNMFRKEEK